MTVRHQVHILGIEPCGADIVTVRLSRPEGYTFIAGQWFTLTLSTDEGEETKTFSHCSAPSDTYLEMTTRLSGSSFKRALAILAPGDRASIAGPGGRLILPDDAHRVCFLVGGVGITPVRSMLREGMHLGREFETALLLYGNRDASCVPFLDELKRMSPLGVHATVVYENPPHDWEGETGFITAEMVRRHLEDRDSVLFFVAGPPVMVSVMERVLEDLGVPKQRRRVERFGPIGS